MPDEIPTTRSPTFYEQMINEIVRGDGAETDTKTTNARTKIAEAMRQARSGFPFTIEFEDGKTLECQSGRDVPHGVPFRTAGSSDPFTVVGSL